MAIDSNSLHKLLAWAVQNGVSDVHLREGDAPACRVRGDLINVKSPPLTAEDMKSACKIIMTGTYQPETLQKLQELDGSFEVPGVARFRFNIFRHDQKLAAVLRLIPLKIPSLDELGYPDVIKKIAAMERGFILVTGATGSGKSTTLAAMIDYLNSTRSGHIVTIEDPVEFVHPQRKCKITQREVGRDTESFATALRAALRQDPDVILVGEMRDAESIDIALKAAETGHTVFSTVHTTDAPKTITRLLSMFPAEEQQTVRLRLADCLKATVSQRLVKRADKNGRICVQEIMFANAAIQECIVDPARTSEIHHFIQQAMDLGSGQTFDQHLRALYERGIITLETAKKASQNAGDFERNINFQGGGHDFTASSTRSVID